MKKSVLVGIFLILLISSIYFTIAAENNTEIDKAYNCLKTRVKDKCSSLSSDGRVFSLLAIEQCKSEILSDIKYKTDTKLTAQAILALSKSNTNTKEAETWLLSQNKTPEEMQWLLQIESTSATTCTITYSGSPYEIDIGLDKKILDTDAGTCLDLYQEYWLEINPTCYSNEFEIKCTSPFSTNLLYKKKTSDTIYVSSNTHTASAGGFTKEKVNSFCFKQGTSCDYEASLWATLVLKSKGYDMSAYLPYLITLMDEPANEKYIPESFLYSLTNNFRSELLKKQSPDGYWTASGDNKYDSAVALFPFPTEEFPEKTKTKNWLLKVQESDGCWGDTRNTAFLLYSIWPRKTTETPDEDDCEESKFFCMSSISCAESGGKELKQYSGCFGANICCDKQQELKTCSEQDGTLCESNEECSGNIVESSDTNSEKSCCIEGKCEIKEVEISECENNGGNCKLSCSDKEKLSSYSCTESSDVCCTSKKSNNLVIIVIVLVALIILVVLGIIFRKQLKEFLIRIKSKFGKDKGKPTVSSSGPRFPPTFPSTPSTRVYPGAIQRKVVTTTTQKLPPKKYPVKKTSEKSDFDDVLKKLKEIGK